MPRGRPYPLGKVNARSVADQLYALHEKADDPSLAQFPAPEDLLAVLAFAERHRAALTGDEARRESTEARLVLVRHIRQLLDQYELRAIQYARAHRAGETPMSWEQLAPLLGVETKNGAMLRAQRLEAAALVEEGERREPETVRRRRERARAEAGRHHALCVAVAGLIENRPALNLDASMSEDLDDIASLARIRRPTEKQRAALAASLRLLLHEMRTTDSGVTSRRAHSQAAEQALQRVEQLLRWP